jgi:hypothetical protein
VSRADFVEETRRMAASVNVTLQEDGPAEAAQAAPSTEPVTPPPVDQEKAEAEPPVEQPSTEAKAEPTAAPEPVEETPAPSEITASDAP